MVEESKILLALTFTNLDTNAKLQIKVYSPVLHKHFSSLINAWCEGLRSRLLVSLNDDETEEILGGDSLLEIVLLGLEFARGQIPEEEETRWVNERGVPSWVVLPKAIPISWGYDLHRKLAVQMNSEVSNFIEKIDKKRRKYEERKE